MIGVFSVDFDEGVLCDGGGVDNLLDGRVDLLVGVEVGDDFVSFSGWTFS